MLLLSSDHNDSLQWMTVQQHIKQLEAFKRKLKQKQTFLPAVADVVDVQADRIFLDGKRANGGKIGDYDTSNELYVNPRTGSPVSFPVAGKPGASRNVENRKTRYFANYKAFKSRIASGKNRRSDRVNLQLTGTLATDYRTGVGLSTSIGGFQSGVKNQRNAEVLEGLIKKYGSDVFILSKAELRRLEENILKATT